MRTAERFFSVILILCVTGALAFTIATFSPPSTAAEEGKIDRRISIEWEKGRFEGEILASDGALSELAIVRGKGTAQASGRFACTEGGPCRLNLRVKGTSIQSGKGSTLVTVQTTANPFSFFLRDVGSVYPIYIPDYGVIVTEASDTRSFDQITSVIKSRGLQTRLQRTESEPEETFEEAAKNSREITCQTWLGLSRDFRIFAIGERLDWIEPRFHAYNVALPDKKVRYDFLMGRGYGPVDKISRRLEDGVMPILHGTLKDDDIHYHLTAFVTLEKSTLSAKALRGTHFLVGEGYGYTDDVVHPAPDGMRPWPDVFKKLFPSVLQEEMNQNEETVLMMSVEMVNTASVPRYAWFRNSVPKPAPGRKFDPTSGIAMSNSGKVFSISTLNGDPLPAEEVGLLLKPGESATIEIRLPHRPISMERASQLAKVRFLDRQRECRQFWQQKLTGGAQIDLPEKRLDEMVRAGLLHLDLILYGREPSGTIAPSVGVYTPIGSESSPIIQFLDSMGWHDVARRSLMFFLDKQHESGYMQNYGDYEIETAGALYTMGEHYRYTRDDQWVKQIAPKLLKSCDFIIKWRQRDLREDLRGKGYGMMVGKVGDPQDRLHQFMFNSYHYIALKRVAEMLASTDPVQSQRIAKEAEAFKSDIRTAFFEAIAKAPVMPLGDGSWCPTAPPWAEYRGALALYADGGEWYTHGAMNVRESVAGALWLIPHEVLQPDDSAATAMLNFHNELLTQQSVAFSQPYYSQHPFVHLARGEAKPFLKAYYNTVAAMADRQTYSFFEHFMGGPNKTHEEAWFLMQTRWMLWRENADTLELLAGIPRSYLEPGKRIEIKDAASYFGPFSMKVESKVNQGRIDAMVECASERHPKRVSVRLPHPEGQRATWAKGGSYDPQTERVTIEPFNGRAKVSLGFGDSKE